MKYVTSSIHRPTALISNFNSFTILSKIYVYTFSFSQLNADIWDTALTSLISHPITNTSVSTVSCIFKTFQQSEYVSLSHCFRPWSSLIWSVAVALYVVFASALAFLFSTWYITARVILLSYKSVQGINLLKLSNAFSILPEYKPKTSQGLTNSLTFLESSPVSLRLYYSVWDKLSSLSFLLLGWYVLASRFFT